MPALQSQARLFPFNCHDVNTCHAFNHPDLFNYFQTYLDTFFLALLLADAAVIRFITSSGTSIPGTLYFMCLAMPADFSGATPARMNAFSWSPISVTIFIHSLNFLTL